MTRPILPRSTRDKILDLTDVEEVRGWRANIQANLLGRDPEPDEERLLWEQEKKLLGGRV